LASAPARSIERLPALLVLLTTPYLLQLDRRRRRHQHRRPPASKARRRDQLDPLGPAPGRRRRFLFVDSGHPAEGSEWTKAEFEKVIGRITGRADRGRRRKALNCRRSAFAATLAAMADDDKLRPFLVDVTVNGTRVQVTLLLKPGVTVEVSEQANDAAQDSNLRGAEVGTATNDKSSQVGSEDSGQRVPDK
jgi:hypothetical protein